MGLSNREVLVVSRIRNDRLAFLRHRCSRAARKVKALLRCDPLGSERLPDLQMKPVRRIELGRNGVGRPGPVQRIEVEARRSRLQELRRGDVFTEHDLGLVEGQIVVRELAEVREAGRDLRRADAARSHGVGDLLPVGLTELVLDAVRPHAREAKRRRQRLETGRERAFPASDTLCEQPLADDEVALRTMVFHDASSVPFLGNEHASGSLPSGLRCPESTRLGESPTLDCGVAPSRRPDVQCLAGRRRSHAPSAERREPSPPELPPARRAHRRPGGAPRRLLPARDGSVLRP
jgi:hypothetical protein